MGLKRTHKSLGDSNIQSSLRTIALDKLIIHKSSQRTYRHYRWKPGEVSETGDIIITFLMQKMWTLEAIEQKT